MDHILQVSPIILPMLDHITSEAGGSLKPLLLHDPQHLLYLLPLFPSFQLPYYAYSSLVIWQKTEGDWGLVHLILTLRKVRRASVTVVTYSRNDQLCESVTHRPPVSLPSLSPSAICRAAKLFFCFFFK